MSWGEKNEKFTVLDVCAWMFIPDLLETIYGGEDWSSATIRR